MCIYILINKYHGHNNNKTLNLTGRDQTRYTRISKVSRYVPPPLNQLIYVHTQLKTTELIVYIVSFSRVQIRFPTIDVVQQAHCTAIKSGAPRLKAVKEVGPEALPEKFLKIRSQILRSGHIWHCFT